MVMSIQCLDNVERVDIPDDSIGSFSNNILNIVLLRNIEGDFSRRILCLSGPGHVETIVQRLCCRVFRVPVAG